MTVIFHNYQLLANGRTETVINKLISQVIFFEKSNNFTEVFVQFKDFNVKAFHDDYFLFIGAKYGEKICQCGALVPNQCFKLSNMENENHCNCDQKDAVDRQDSGFITNMVCGALK